MGGKIFIFEAPRQPYTGTRGLVSWDGGGCCFLSLRFHVSLKRPCNGEWALFYFCGPVAGLHKWSDCSINPMRFFWNQKAHNTKIGQTFFLNNCHYKITVVIKLFRLKYLSPIRITRRKRTIRQKSDRFDGPDLAVLLHYLVFYIYIEHEFSGNVTWNS